MANLKIIALSLAIMLGACGTYEEVTAHKVDNALILNGVIDSETLGILRSALRSNPGIDRLILNNIPGSADDESSLQSLSRFIRASGLTIEVPAGSMVASGGTDMVVMAKNRVIEPGACIGVHSWAAGGLLGSEAGADLPRSDPSHQLYLKFYREMGIPEAFYWFTLDAAGPEDVYWMTEEEINRFGLSTTLVRNSPAETAGQRKARCDAQLF